MYGYLSKTKQSLALKLMAIYTLKANVLVHFSHLNYLLVLSRFKSLYFHFCETAINSYRFIHQSSPFKFAIHLYMSVCCNKVRTAEQNNIITNSHHRTRWLYCVECPQYSTRRRSTSNIHRSSMLHKNR